MQSWKIKKGGNSNLIDCNAIARKIKKGRQLQFNRLQCNRTKLKREATPDCNAIAQNKKKGGNPSENMNNI